MPQQPRSPAQARGAVPKSAGPHARLSKTDSGYRIVGRNGHPLADAAGRLRDTGGYGNRNKAERRVDAMNRAAERDGT
jgi:hypothetical protein